MVSFDSTAFRHAMVSAAGALLCSLVPVGAAVLPAQGAAAAMPGL